MKKLLLFTISILMLTGCQKDKSDVNSIQIQEIHAYAKSIGLDENDFSYRPNAPVSDEIMTEIKASLDKHAVVVLERKAKNKIWDEYLKDLKALGEEPDLEAVKMLMKNPKYTELFKGAIEENNQ